MLEGGEQGKEEGKKTTWVERRWARDGKMWTSGALLNGLDLMREFVKEYWPEMAAAIVPTCGIPIRATEYEY